MTKTEIETEALERARNGQTWTNYPAIFAGFIEKGIAENDIKPRENVFTFHAWKALGRSVNRVAAINSSTLSGGAIPPKPLSRRTAKRSALNQIRGGAANTRWI